MNPVLACRMSCRCKHITQKRACSPCNQDYSCSFKLKLFPCSICIRDSCVVWRATASIRSVHALTNKRTLQRIALLHSGRVVRICARLGNNVSSCSISVVGIVITANDCNWHHLACLSGNSTPHAPKIRPCTSLLAMHLWPDAPEGCVDISRMSNSWAREWLRHMMLMLRCPFCG